MATRALDVARPRRRRISRDWAFALALTLPGLVWFLVLTAYPAVFSFWISFHEWKIIGEPRWVGLSNYLRAFADPVNLVALRNTAVYALITVPGQLLLGFGLALLVHRTTRFGQLFRLVYYFPVVASWLVASLVFQFLFHPEGVVNYVLSGVLGLYPQGFNWFKEAPTALAAIAALGIWKGVGWVMVIYLAALQAMPRELEEAAEVDGASRAQITRFVTFPLLRPATTFISVMLSIGALQSFIQFYIITRGAPNHETETFLTYIYNQGFAFLDFGYASALAFLVAALIVVVSVVQLRYFRGGTL